MFDYSKLSGRITEIFRTKERFAQYLGISASAVSRGLSGKYTFSQTTICKWANALKIPFSEIGIYFFKLKVHEDELTEGGE